MERFYFETKGWNVIKNKEDFFNLLQSRDWKWVIEERRETRSFDQNRYLWGGVYGTIAKVNWDDPEYIHWICGMRFLVDHSKKMPYVRSTATLDTKEFTEYVEKIKDWVSEFEITIPSPEEYKRNFT